MRRSSFVLALSLACGLSGVACKQDLGERCERNSDCASGFCRGATIPTTAAGGRCDTGPTVVDAAPVDAARTDATKSDATDATDAADAADATLDVTSGPDAVSVPDADQSDVAGDASGG